MQWSQSILCKNLEKIKKFPVAVLRYIYGLGIGIGIGIANTFDFSIGIANTQNFQYFSTSILEAVEKSAVVRFSF